MGKTVRHNSVWNVAANAVYAVCQWLLVIILAKLGSPNTVGVFGLGVAISVPTIVLTDLQLRAIQATDATNEFKFRTYFGLRLTGGLAALAIISIISGLFVSSGSEVAVVLVGAGRLIESLSEITHGLMQKHERMDLAAKGLIARSVLSLLLFAVAFASTLSIEVALLGYIAGSFIAFVAIDVPLSKTMLGRDYQWFRFDLLSMSRLAKLAAPLGLVAMLVALNQHVPRHAIAAVVGEYGLGIFTAIVYLALAATRLVNALCQAVTPQMSRAYASGNLSTVESALRRILYISGALGILGIMFAAFAAPLVLQLVYTRDYVVYAPLLVVAMLVALPVYLSTCLSHTMTAIRALTVQLPLLISVFCVTLVISTLFVPRFGIAGGIAALGAGAVVQTIGSGYVVVQRLRHLRAQTVANT